MQKPHSQTSLLIDECHPSIETDKTETSATTVSAINHSDCTDPGESQRDVDGHKEW